MNAPDLFFDSNVLLYLLSGDAAKADLAEKLIQQGGHVSVQVLNEFASVAIRKLGMTPAEVREVLTPIRTLCVVHPLTEATHDLGLNLAERYQLSLYDALIAAAALIAGCTSLLSEDMQNGLILQKSLRVHNPFHLASAG